MVNVVVSRHALAAIFWLNVGRTFSCTTVPLHFTVIGVQYHFSGFSQLLWYVCMLCVPTGRPSIFSVNCPYTWFVGSSAMPSNVRRPSFALLSAFCMYVLLHPVRSSYAASAGQESVYVTLSMTFELVFPCATRHTVYPGCSVSSSPRLVILRSTLCCGRLCAAAGNTYPAATSNVANN